MDFYIIVLNLVSSEEIYCDLILVDVTMPFDNNSFGKMSADHLSIVLKNRYI